MMLTGDMMTLSGTHDLGTPGPTSILARASWPPCSGHRGLATWLWMIAPWD